jgi:hypothetical protein
VRVQARILSKEEISNLNKDGAKLHDNKFYAQFFLINDQPNNAANPYPFQIVPESLEKVAKTAVGRPFIIGPSSDKHVVDPFNPLNAEAIINYQKQHAGGEVVYQYINPGSGNANVIVDIFPEYVEDVKSGRIPPYVSPLVENTTPGVEVVNGRLIVRDARILHLQAVDSPGYGEVAKIHGTCEGMLDKCVSELRVLGASGKLKQFQHSLSSSQDNRDANPVRLADSTAATTLTAEQITALVKDSVDKAQTAFEEKHSKILGASSAAAALEQKEKKDPPSKPEGEDAAQDIESHPFVQKLKSDLDTLKAAKEESDKLLSLEQRKQQAAQIVEVELLTKTIPLNKKADRIKALVESKDDLGSIAKYMQANRGKILGATGRGDIAEMHTDSAEPVGFELEDNIGGRY